MTTTTKRSPGWWLQALPEDVRLDMARKGGLNARKNPNTHRWKAGTQEPVDAGRRGGKVSKRGPAQHEM